MQKDKPFSQACENNKAPILEKLAELFKQPGTILEIGSGTGQHAVHFARHLPHLVWQSTDHPQNAQLARAWIDDSDLSNINSPIALNVLDGNWADLPEIDGAFSANTAHIMAWEEVKAMFRGVAGALPKDGIFCLYGPFSYDGQHTSDSNARFDLSLRTQAPHMGIRDMGDLKALGKETGLVLEEDFGMPANNRLLVWRRVR
jgi:cyclopropane fatty-acyl-phospholipid synthase-like methyltransferase